jgi:glutamate-1-semialdehyde aminotransferase/spore coat polysaccharide biosynthesis protein SpsF (cytidylyltransferase family)
MKTTATFHSSGNASWNASPEEGSFSRRGAAVVVAIVQARMSSTRLPGKSMAEIDGRPMLWHVVNRVRRSRLVSKVVVATTDKPADDPIAAMCQEEDILCFRGSEDDVLDRFYRAAHAHSADVVVRITADCPLIDAAVIDEIVSRYKQSDCDYVSNTFRYTFPDGLDTEVFSFRALDRAWREARKPSEREHVTPYLRTGKFRTANVESDAPVGVGNLRWTVDHASDLEFVRGIFAVLSGDGYFGFQDVLDLLRKRPDLAATQTETISNEGYYRSLYSQAVAGAAPQLALTNSQAWLARSRKVIPGCAQTFSKGYTQYVEGAAPIFLQRGKGCRVWDVDGNEYIDYVQGLLPNILGYANEEVDRAAAAQVAEGHSFTLPHPLEVQLAERLTQLIPCAEMVRFGKNGSDATSGAVRAARAFTGRDRIACCGYHGWQDWYIGSTTRNAGVPAGVRALTHPFRYNDVSSLEKLLGEHPGEFAAVIMEPTNFESPAPGFLQGVKDLAQRHSALLIFDEICSGFHFGLGGAQKLLGVTPDLACFGKAMGNGFPISCIVGRADVMRVFEEIFFSFTFAGEVASMAAAMKVLDILENTDALARMEANGRTLQNAFNALAKEAGLADRLKAVAHPAWSLLKFRDSDGNDSQLVKSLFQQEAVKRGVLLLATHNLSAAHDLADIHQTLEAYAEVFKTLSGWLHDPDPARFLEGPVIQPVFRVR